MEKRLFFQKSAWLVVLVLVGLLFLSPLSCSVARAAESCTATIDVVFYIDTSASMDTEWNTVCNNVSTIVAALEADGNTINYRIYGLKNPRGCGSRTIESNEENWGPATSTVARSSAWTENAIRIAVPMSDECPYEGQPCDANDTASITRAIADANANQVIVSPIISTSGTPYALGSRLATATGGVISNASDPQAIVAAVTNLITAAIGDSDGDGHLSLTCGGDDCDDADASIYPGQACRDQCFDTTVKAGVCQAGTGQCTYENPIATCENLGDVCRPDACKVDETGNARCVADIGENLCGGMVPCGRMLDNPATTLDETATCSFCHLALVASSIINYLLGLASTLALLAIILAGFLYILSAGNPQRKNAARSYLANILKGYAVVFLAFLIVDFVLSAWGFLNPVLGKWNVVCAFFSSLF